MKKAHPITAVSEESPNNFHVNNGMVLSQIEKNERISSDFSSNRFLNRLKKNNIYDKPMFNYSDIRNQAFDYHSITPSKAVDLSYGLSPGLRSLTPFSSKYCKFLSEGFGKRRGQFTLEASQSKVPRLGVNEFNFISNQKFRFTKKEKVSEKNLKKVEILKFLAKSEKRTKSRSTDGSTTPKIKKSLRQIDEFEQNLLKFKAGSNDRLPRNKHFYDLS
jgi:hypothetical protein